ncbi:hypothetical protein Poli38472_010177 [Pythium oligandrum]|uniref:Ankyrin repeat protein n=1 Tax=Pythium oligandrum TaxID=41045 RepID=A0A8K1FHB6_PYTOL|nr:hypothetical protein Poli38472_010177 [Pythium oligandrum]|eukprot:TMW58618.1 hypothetical protein Poli38472_010177 [Pythium oligandrum]
MKCPRCLTVPMSPRKKLRRDDDALPRHRAVLSVLTSAELLRTVICYLPGVPRRLLTLKQEYELPSSEKVEIYGWYDDLYGDAEVPLVSEEMDDIDAKWRRANAGLVEMAILADDKRAIEMVYELHRQPEFEQHPMLRVQFPMRFAAAEGKIKMLEWLATRPERDEWLSDPWLLDSAICSVDIDVAQWVHRHFQPVSGDKSVIRSRTMDFMALHGNVTLMRWLVPHYKDQVVLSTLAIDGATRNGHLDMVKYLHEERNDGCTIDAVDIAANNGHLDVVKFLFEHRQEKGSMEALNDAAANARGEVLRYLLTKMPDIPVSDAVTEAARKNDFDLIKLLYDARPSEVISSRAFDFVQDVEILKYLRDRGASPT